MLLSQVLNIFGLVLVLTTLPLLVELLVLTVAALIPAVGEKNQNAARPDGFVLTVVVPAHNEEALIGRCVRSLLTSAGLGTELLVIAHNCTDATAAEAEASGARVLVLDDPEQTGKGCALSYGFATAMAGPSQAVMVVDADSVVSPGLIAALRQRFLLGAQALQCRYEVYNSDDNRRTKLMTLAFQAFNVIRPRGRERLGLSAGILGNGFALHRDVLTRIPYGAYSVVEDLEYHLALVRAGIRVEFIDTAAVRGEMAVSDRGARTQRARWEGGRQRMMKRWAPRLMVDLLSGRFRLIEPLLDLLAAPIATEVALLLVAACLPLPWLRLYALGGFLVLIVHVTAAAACGSDFWKTMGVLTTAPVYILWKLWVFPEIWRTSRANSAWVRTERDVPADGQ
ncbi:MAG: glycosyltransferase family 2 protein [Terracidiphilus sp.]|jgi:cellulose synthase/poly-beta-1,6-N-acetylglucosamine synthase-like glycosyltransferase